MAVIDNSLKQLQYWILQINDGGAEEITDDSPYVQPLCEALEVVFRKGVRQTTSIFNWERSDYYTVYEKISTVSRMNSLSINYFYETIIDKINASRRVKTPLGRGRYLVRMLLQNKMISVPVNFIVSNQNYFIKMYDANNSILFDEVNVHVLISLLEELDRKTFKLDLQNADFLDDDWRLPKLVHTEFVPCKDLGICLRILNEHYVVEAVDPKGVAGEDDRIETGDVLTQLFDRPLRGFPGVLKNVLAANRLKPVALSIAKARIFDQSETFYRPIYNLLSKNNCIDILSESRNVHADVYRNSLEGTKNKQEQVSIAPLSSLDAGSCSLNEKLRFRYIGQFPTGCIGTVDKISMAIGNVLFADRTKPSFRPVKFNFGELSLQVFELDKATAEIISEDKPLFEHVYPRISSCGRRADMPRFFAYIVGETTCSIAKSFVCVVFEAYVLQEAHSMVNSIALGFERTHWAL